MLQYPLFLPNITKTFANFDNAHTDFNSRLEESREALFAIIEKNFFSEIVIVDGSNNKVLSEEEILKYAKKGIKIEQLLFLQDKKLVEEYGKGHGEMQITNYMVENSELVKKAGGFVKLTPRYFFDNIDEILPKISNEENVFFYYYPFPIRNLKAFVMSIFYKTSLEFYKKNIMNSITKHSKDVSGLMESVLYQQLSPLKKESLYLPFPYFSGISGTTGKKIRNQYIVFRNICSRLGLIAYRFPK